MYTHTTLTKSILLFLFDDAYRDIVLDKRQGCHQGGRACANLSSCKPVRGVVWTENVPQAQEGP